MSDNIERHNPGFIADLTQIIADAVSGPLPQTIHVVSPEKPDRPLRSGSSARHRMPRELRTSLSTSVDNADFFRYSRQFDGATRRTINLVEVAIGSFRFKCPSENASDIPTLRSHVSNAP